MNLNEIKFKGAAIQNFSKVLLSSFEKYEKKLSITVFTSKGGVDNSGFNNVGKN